MLLKINM